MQRFMVEGAVEKSGAEVNFAVDGENAEEVMKAARRKGVLVSKITPKTPPPPKPLPAIDYAPEPTYNSFRPAPPVGRVQPPAYKALETMSAVFKCFAILSYLGAVGLVLLTFIGASHGNVAADGFPILMIMLPSIAACVIVGLLFHGLGEFLSAFRDMARNSFN